MLILIVLIFYLLTHRYMNYYQLFNPTHILNRIIFFLVNALKTLLTKIFNILIEFLLE